MISRAPTTSAGAPPAGPFGGPPSLGTRYATRGMVAAASPAAAAVGLRVLLAGGNAFDAAIAVAMVEGLTIPMMCGLGGDMFAVLYDACSRRVVGINGSGAAPRQATSPSSATSGPSTACESRLDQ